jgi:mono/diheme cytochrome c family protein
MPAHDVAELRREAAVTKASLVMVAFASAALNAGAFAQNPKTVDEGKRAYEAQCSVCHGMGAKGNGLYTPSLKIPPSDLTTLAKRNGGVFPVERITKVIDGRTAIAAHGTREMPIWGTRFAVNAGEHFGDVPYDQEAYLRGQILALIDYLDRLQQR